MYEDSDQVIWHDDGSSHTLTELCVVTTACNSWRSFWTSALLSCTNKQILRECIIADNSTLMGNSRISCLRESNA